MKTVTLYLERARQVAVLADHAPAKDKAAILEIANAWLKLAEAAAEEKAKQDARPSTD